MTTQPAPPPRRSVFTLGSFDGAHAGHQALIREARRIADEVGPKHQIRVLAQAFDPSPASVLRPDVPPERLSTFEQRRDWLLAAGADEVLKLEPTPHLLGLSAADFVAQKVARHYPIAWVEGPDFRFGHNREGNVETLARLGKLHSFKVSVVEPVTVALDDHSIVPARSTVARWLLLQGRVRDAATVLTRPHQLLGTVVSGDRRGRTIGYPTANIESPCLSPADGVYAGIATLPDGRRFAAAVSVGTKPSFSGTSKRTIEAFLLNRPAAGQPWSVIPGLREYGWTIALDMVAWIRDQVKFDSLSDLIAQIERDCERVAEIAAPHLTHPPTTPKRLQEAGA